jgi:hypothetical protein
MDTEGRRMERNSSRASEGSPDLEKSNEDRAEERRKVRLTWGRREERIRRMAGHRRCRGNGRQCGRRAGKGGGPDVAEQRWCGEAQQQQCGRAEAQRGLGFRE